MDAPRYLRTATTPRMVVLLLVLLAVAAVCGRLGVWQLDRATQRAEAAEAVAAQAQVQSPPVPLTEVLQPQQPFPGSLVGRKVAVTGRFEGDTLLVPGRAVGDRTGYLLLDRFRVTGGADAPAADDDAAPSGGAPDGGAAPGGDTEGALLPVVRGWVPDPDDAPAPPPGDVELVGYLQAGEAAGEGDLPPGQVAAVSTGQLANLWDAPIWSGYLVAAEADAAALADGAVPLPPPTVPDSEGVDLQNLAYALQWWIFGGFAVLLWLRLVRDEAQQAAEQEAVGRH